MPKVPPTSRLSSLLEIAKGACTSSILKTSLGNNVHAVRTRNTLAADTKLLFDQLGCRKWTKKRAASMLLSERSYFENTRRESYCKCCFYPRQVADAAQRIAAIGSFEVGIVQRRVDRDRSERTGINDSRVTQRGKARNSHGCRCHS